MKPIKVWAHEGSLITYDDESTHITRLEGVCVVGAGSTVDHTYILNSNGGVYDITDLHKEICSGIKEIVCTFSECLCVSDANVVSIGKRGVRYLHKSSFNRICAGAKFAIGLEANGDVYHYGQAGLFGFSDEYNNRFTRTKFSNIQQIECGFYHAILLQENGTAISIGQEDLCFDPIMNVKKIYAYGKSSFLWGDGFHYYHRR